MNLKIDLVYDNSVTDTILIKNVGFCEADDIKRELKKSFKDHTLLVEHDFGIDMGSVRSYTFELVEEEKKGWFS
jgi:hypothetical protein